MKWLWVIVLLNSGGVSRLLVSVVWLVVCFGFRLCS